MGAGAQVASIHSLIHSNWTPFGGIEEYMQTLTRRLYLPAIVIAIVATLMLVWLSLGVGIIGADGDPANRMYFGVAAIGIIGTIIARTRAHGMARTLFAMAATQAAIAVIAVVARLGLPYSGPAEILLLNGFFVVVFAAAGWLFSRAARQPEHRQA